MQYSEFPPALRAAHIAMITRRTRKRYAKVAFDTPAAMADEAAGVLVAAGALGCAVAGMSLPGARPPAVVTLEAYFESASAARVERIGRTLASAGMLAPDGRRRLALTTVADPGWATMWQRRFEPFRIGRRFLIVPPWNRRREPGRISIAIRPGRAFGTGHHPSTAGALRAIERIMAERVPASALEVGTGSGILAMALALGGVARVVAIDIDTGALDNARENAELNSVARSIRFSAVPLASVRGRFELIVANILATVLSGLAGEIARRLAPGGRLVLGGILARETAAVRRRYARLGLRCVERRASRGWTTLVLAP
jgi:ribosomal protein L11 methyltransferase